MLIPQRALLLRSDGTPTPGPAPAPSSYGWNFRETLGFVTDVSPDLFTTASTVGVAGPAGSFGFLNAPASAAQDNNITFGSKAAGKVTFSNLNNGYFTTGPIANQLYRLRLCTGLTFAATQTTIAIWDGYCGETSNLSNDIYTASGFATIGRVVITAAGRLYFVVASGTMAATAPTDESGSSFASGAATLRYIKTAKFFLDLPAQPNIFTDATGVSHTNTSWQTNNALSAAFLLSSGHATVSRASTSGDNYPRHIGLIGQ